MSKQERDYNAEFQDRIDELMLLERKASERAKNFLEASRENQQQIQGSLSNIIKDAKYLKEMAERCASYKSKVIRMLVLLSSLSIAIFGGSVWYINSARIKVAELELWAKAVRFDLKYEPVFVRHNNAVYTRIKPGSEITIMKDNKLLPGAYAIVETAEAEFKNQGI